MTLTERRSAQSPGLIVAQSVPPDGERARAVWAQGLKDRNDAVEKARLRVDRARRRVEQLDAERLRNGSP